MNIRESRNGVLDQLTLLLSTELIDEDLVCHRCDLIVVVLTAQCVFDLIVRLTLIVVPVGL